MSDAAFRRIVIAYFRQFGVLVTSAPPAALPALHQRDTLVEKFVNVSREAHPPKSVERSPLERQCVHRLAGFTEEP